MSLSGGRNSADVRKPMAPSRPRPCGRHTPGWVNFQAGHCRRSRTDTAPASARPRPPGGGSAIAGQRVLVPPVLGSVSTVTSVFVGCVSVTVTGGPAFAGQVHGVGAAVLSATGPAV